MTETRDPILEAKLFTIYVGGVPFTMYRRTAQIMFEINGFLQTAGAIAGEQMSAKKKDGSGISQESIDRFSSRIEATLRRVMYEPRVAPEGEETVQGSQYTYDDLSPFVEGLFTAFMGSGLSASPFPNSCEESPD